MSVIDLNQGGRLYLQMTDVDPEDVRVGDEVVLTLRRRKEGPTMHHYYVTAHLGERYRAKNGGDVSGKSDGAGVLLITAAQAAVK